MGDRLDKKELDAIKASNNVQKLWSWSRLKTAKDDKYSYFLKYVVFAEPDRTDSIYGMMGGFVHDLTEQMQLGQITNQDALAQYEDKALELSIMDYKFNRTEEDRNDSIGEKYHFSNKHFLERFKPFEGHNVRCEEFIQIKLGAQMCIGYVDFSREILNDDGTLEALEILDWKTSSLYIGKKAEKEKGQLLLYAHGKTQQGYPLEKIRAGWNFTKYCKLKIMQKNGKIRESNALRFEIGSKLASSVKSWMKDKSTANYEDYEIEGCIEELERTNDLDILPAEIREKFSIEDCIVYVSITEDEIDELVESLRQEIFTVTKLEAEYEKTKDDKIFWSEVNSENEYFFSNISEFSRKLHKPYDEWLKNKEMFRTEEDDELSIEELLLGL